MVTENTRKSTPPRKVTIRGETLMANNWPQIVAIVVQMKWPKQPPIKTDKMGFVLARRIEETWERSPHSAKKIIIKTSINTDLKLILVDFFLGCSGASTSLKWAFSERLTRGARSLLLIEDESTTKYSLKWPTPDFLLNSFFASSYSELLH